MTLEGMLETRARKQQKRKREQETREQIQNRIKRRMEQPSSWVAGIDMSLQNPGVSWMCPKCASIKVYGWASKAESYSNCSAHDGLSCFSSSDITWNILQQTEDEKSDLPSESTRIKRMINCVDRVLGVLDEHARTCGDPSVVWIERYALQIKSSSVSTLCELGGILRAGIERRSWIWAEVSPASVKKTWTGNGKATKTDMCKKIRWDEKMSEVVWKKNKEPSQKEPKHPWEDMVDALAILYSSYESTK